MARPRARIDFALQVLKIGLDAAGFRMAFRVRRHRNLEVADARSSPATRSEA